MPRDVEDQAENDTSDEREEADDAEDEDEDEGESGAAAPPTAPVVVPRPRARRAGVLPPVPLSNFGGIPEGVTHWGVSKRAVAGHWEIQSWAAPGSSVALREWPLAELSEATIEQRWGVGAYQVQWVRPMANGGRKVMRGARVVEIIRPEAPPAATPSAPLSGIEGLEPALRFMEVIDNRATDKLTGLAQLAQLFGGRQQGVSGEELRAILRDEREAHAAAIRAAVEPLEQRIAALADDDDDDDDDDDSLVDAAASAAAPLFKGRKWWQQVGNFLATNPEVAKQVLPVAIGAVQTVTGALASAVAQPRPQPPRARAQLVPQPLPPQPVAQTAAPVPIDDRNDPPPMTTATTMPAPASAPATAAAE